MYKILSLVCILAALLTALFLTSWVKSKRGTGEETARLYGIIKSRNSNFWGFHYIPVIAFLLLAVLASGLGTGWLNAAACLAGGIITFASVYAGSLNWGGNGIDSLMPARLYMYQVRYHLIMLQSVRISGHRSKPLTEQALFSDFASRLS